MHWLEQLLGPYVELLGPVVQQIVPHFNNVMRILVAALDRLAQPLAPVLHHAVDAASPHLLVRLHLLFLACNSILRCFVGYHWLQYVL